MINKAVDMPPLKNMINFSILSLNHRVNFYFVLSSSWFFQSLAKWSLLASVTNEIELLFKRLQRKKRIAFVC